MTKTKDKEKEKNPSRKAQKFFFDMNSFDDGYEEEIIPEAPPPPVFSAEELAAAKKEAHDSGREEGLAEAKASRGKCVADLLGTVTAHFQTLFAAEELRETQYEGEAVFLTQIIFKKLFPALNTKQGLNEITKMIAAVLDNQKNKKEIIIELHPDYSDSIRKLLETIKGSLQDDHKVRVTGNKTMGAGDCHMVWNDGGAGRDVTKLSEEIHRKLEHMLADKPLLQDNREKYEDEDESENQNEAQKNIDGADNDVPEDSQQEDGEDQ